MARNDGITRMVSERTGAVTWRARISYTDSAGRRRHRSKTFPTRQAAKAWRAERMREVDTDTYRDPSPLTLAEVAARWLETVARGRAPSTHVAYRHAWERIVAPALGERRIALIRATEVQAFYDALGQRYAANTVAMAHKVLRGVFGHAVTDGILASNPADGRRLPSDRLEVGPVWTPDEVRAFMRHVATDDDALLFAVVLGAGLRIGEALALAWADVDLEDRSARVHRTVQRAAGGLRIAPMTKTGHPRVVILPGATVLALRRQLARDGVRDHPSGLVFPGRGDGILNPATARRQLGILCEQLGLPQIGLHGLRRTAVTMAVIQGVNPATAAAQFGHTVEVMLKHYAKVSADMQRIMADAMDEMFGGDDAGAITRRG